MQKTGADVAYSDWEKVIELERGIFETCEKVVTRRIEDVNPILQIALITDFSGATRSSDLSAHTGGKDRGMEGMAADHPGGCAFSSRCRALSADGLYIHRASVLGTGCTVETSLSRRSTAAFVADVFKKCLRSTGKFRSQGYDKFGRTSRARTNL